MASKISIGEGTIGRIVLIVWFLTFVFGAFLPFPFGFVFMGIFGLFVGLFVALIYVYGMEMLFGEKSKVDGGGSKFNFLRGKPKREGESDGIFDGLTKKER